MPTSVNHSPSRPRVLSLSAGVLSGVIALTLLVSGGAMLWADAQKDADGYLFTDRETFRTDTAALVTGNVDVDLEGGDWLVESSDFDDVELSVAPKSSEPVFVGVAPTDDVRRYLDRTAHTMVDDIDYAPFGIGGFDPGYRDKPGAGRAGRPADETFWTASASGAGVQDLEWDVGRGDWSIVVMNADGSPGVSAGVKAGAKLPVLDELAWTVVGGGVLFVFVTAGLVMLAVRPRRTPTGPPAAARAGGTDQAVFQKE